MGCCVNRDKNFIITPSQLIYNYIEKIGLCKYTCKMLQQLKFEKDILD